MLKRAQMEAHRKKHMHYSSFSSRIWVRTSFRSRERDVGSGEFIEFGLYNARLPVNEGSMSL